MSKREVKGDRIKIVGDLVKIEVDSTRGVGAVVGGVLGTIAAPGVGTAVGAGVGAAVGHGKKAVYVPKSDVVEIREDSKGRVTVVLDEERGRMREASQGCNIRVTRDESTGKT